MTDIILQAVLNKIDVWKQMYANHEATADEINDRNWHGMCVVLADRIEELERRITVGKKIWFRRYQSHCFWRRRARKAEKQLEAYETVIRDEIAGKIISSVAVERLQAILTAALGEN